jgi:hypothetical protein
MESDREEVGHDSEDDTRSVTSGMSELATGVGNLTVAQADTAEVDEVKWVDVSRDLKATKRLRQAANVLLKAFAAATTVHVP